MLPAPGTELLQFQPVRLGFAVLRRRIIPLFAITALHCNDLSGHTEPAPSFLALRVLAQKLNAEVKIQNAEFLFSLLHSYF
jgi:hypothetical protein